MGNRLRVLIQRVQMSLRIKLFKDRGTVPAAAESAVHIDTAAADRKAGDGFIEHHRTMQVHGEVRPAPVDGRRAVERSEEHTSELQSLMRISSAVFCLKKKK